MLLVFVICFPAQSQLFDKLKKEANNLLGNGTGSFTSDEAAKAIKEALISGVSKGSDKVSQVDGFFKNPEIKIPVPKEAKIVETSMKKIGMGAQVDKAVLSLNRAAEDAAKSAKPIFVDAVKGMTINDAVNIVKGDSTAATKYLKGKTTASLTKTFAPIIKSSLDKVDATKYWGEVMTTYNKIPFVQKVNPDLTQYVTQKAMDALFLMISREETLIRKDPVAQTTDLLKKVFGK